MGKGGFIFLFLFLSVCANACAYTVQDAPLLEKRRKCFCCPQINLCTV